MTFETSGDVVRVQHFGQHKHPRPHPIRPDAQGRERFKDIVRIAPEVKPKSLQIGTTTREPITSVHPAFRNLDRLAYHRSKTLKRQTTSSTLGHLANFEKGMQHKCIISTNFQESGGHIIMQTAFMKTRLSARESSLETDSVEGFIEDEHCSTVNLAITSGYCPTVNRNVPLLLSILFGKSAAHYEQHFSWLFKTMDMSYNFEEWSNDENGFPGNTCDFSDAERSGFEAAIRTYCSIIADTPLDFNMHFRCCNVHFKRTLSRIARNAAVIPPSKEKEFYQAVSELLSIDNLSKFNESVESLNQQYPKAKPWLKWYITRGSFIFPAMAQADISHMSKDTNAQESVGADIQRTATKAKLSIMEALEHLTRYMNNAEFDYSCTLTGVNLRYKKPSRKRKQSNDGRPPDTTKQLVIRRSGRPRGSRNVIPKLAGDIHMPTFGIPWSMTFKEFSAVNTCAVDTTLMVLFFLITYGDLNTSTASNYALLSQVINLIRHENYDEARFLWYTKVLSFSEKDSCSEFMSIEDVIGNELSATLFQFQINRASHCKSEFCTAMEKFVKKICDRVYVSPGCKRIGREALEHVFEAKEDPCDEHTETMPQDVPDDAFRQESLPGFVLDSDGKCEKEEKKVWTCRGTRSTSLTEAIKFPQLLMVQATVGNNLTIYDKPEMTLQMGQSLYKLAAVIYTTNTRDHFFCHTFIQGVPVFFNGLSTPRCQWNTISKYEESRFAIAQVWYQRCYQEKSREEIMKELDVDESDSQLSFKSLSHNVIPQPKATGKFGTENMPPGMAIQPVNKRGPCPHCQGCRKKMDREDMRVTKKINDKMGWNSLISYHTNSGCFDMRITESEKAVLKMILEEEDF